MQRQKRPKDAVWFVLRRDSGDAWDPVELEGESFFKLDGAIDPEQLAQLDADARGDAGTYRIEFRPKRKNGRHLGDSPPFSASPTKKSAPPSSEEDGDDDEDEYDEDDDSAEDEAQPPPLPRAPKPRTPVNGGRANGNGHHAVEHAAVPIARRPPPQAYALDPHMFSFQAFDYLTASLEAREQRAAAEREARDRERLQFQMEMFSFLRSEGQRTNDFIRGESERRATELQAFFERLMAMQQEKHDAELERDEDGQRNGDEIMQEIARQLAELKANAQANNGQITDEEGEPIDASKYMAVIVDAVRFFSGTSWAKQHLPKLAELFAEGAAVP